MLRARLFFSRKVNKNMWSTSFVLVVSGFGSIALAALYLIIDDLKLWDGAPFR